MSSELDELLEALADALADALAEASADALALLAAAPLDEQAQPTRKSPRLNSKTMGTRILLFCMIENDSMIRPSNAITLAPIILLFSL